MRTAHRPGQSLTPGLAGSTSDLPSESFDIISCNASGWASFKLVAQTLSSRIILGQEVATLDSSVDANSRWLSSCGFHSFWAPSRSTEHDGVSAGVLVAADRHLHPFVPPSFSSIVIPHRLVCALVPMGRLGVVACYSFYGLTGGALDSTNLGYLHDLGRHIISHGYPWIVGGDFNFAPDLLEGSDFVRRICGVTFRPESPTCFSGISATVRDYFIVDSRLSQAVVALETLDSPCRPHTPVRLSLDLSVPMDVVVHAWTFKSLPTCRPFGPPAVADLPDSAFEDFHLAALSIPLDPHPDESGRHLSTADVCLSEVQAGLDLAYNCWIRLAEAEICAAVDADPALVGAGRGAETRYLYSSRARRWTNRFPEVSGPSKCLYWYAGLLQRTLYALRGFVCPGPFHSRFKGYISLLRCKSSIVSCSMGRNPFRRFAPVLWSTYSRSCSRTSRLIHLLLNAQSQEHFRALAVSLQFHLEYWATLSRGRADTMASDERAAAAKSFASWLDEALAGGAGVAHRASKPRPFGAPTVVKVGGRWTAAKSAVLDSFADTWGALWSEKPAPSSIRLPCLDAPPALPALSPTQIRSVAQSYPVKTDVRDGFHPRHYVLLSDRTLKCLSVLYMYMEASGLAPSPVRTVTASLIPKPSGGLRGIGLLRSFIRIWERCQKPLVVQWESLMGSGPEFSASRGRSPLDAVWRRAVNAELAHSNGQIACSILMDLRKCYDMLAHLPTAVRGVAAGFPIALLRISMAMYTWARRVVLDGAFSRCIFPHRSIIVGSCFATYQLKVFLRPLIARMLSLHPHSTLEFFVDDAVVSCLGASADFVSAVVTGSARDLVKALEDDGLGIASDKTSIVSSSLVCSKKVARNLGYSPRVVARSAKDLGVDFTCGNRLSRRLLVTSTWRRRKARFRVNRIARFAAVRRKASKLYFTGALPEMTYGVEIVGASDATLVSLRRDAAKCLGISGHRRSLDLTFGLASWLDPAAGAAVAPLVRYAKELWAGSTPGHDCSVLDYSSLVRGFHSCMLSGKAPRSWGYSRGPLSAAFLSARRIGWIFVSPVICVDDDGNKFNLFQLSPAELRKLALAAFTSSSLGRAFARLSAADLPADRDRSLDRPFVAPVVEAFRSKQLSSLESAALLRHFAGGVYLASDLVRMGFKIPLACPLCHSAPDTLVHRLYHCRYTQHSWSRLPQRILDVAKLGNSLFFLRALCSLDSSIPLPASTSTFEFVDLSGADGEFKFRAEDGPVYYDGSCSDPTSAVLARASFAAVQICPDGQPLKYVLGAVPRPLKQSATMAEHCALASVYFYADPDVHAFGDCMSTIISFRRGPAWAEAPRRPTASAWRSIRLYSHGSLASVSHVKAHRSRSSIDSDDPIEMHHFLGNEQADALAKRANILQPDIYDAAVEYRARFFDLKLVAIHIAKSMALFPSFKAQTAGVDLVRPDSFKSGRCSATRHCTTWFGNRWLCVRCCATSHLRSGPSYACTGRHSLAEGLLADQRGHHLAVVVVDGTSPLFFCRKCGCFADVKGVGLFKQCRVSMRRAADHMGKQCLRRIYAGKHPTDKHRMVSAPADLVIPPKISFATCTSPGKVFSPL